MPLWDPFFGHRGFVLQGLTKFYKLKQLVTINYNCLQTITMI
jgi:hypothetical protein